MTRSQAPPPGVYAPLVTFFKEDEEFDEESHVKHVLRLAEVCTFSCACLVLQRGSGHVGHMCADGRADTTGRVDGSGDFRNERRGRTLRCGRYIHSLPLSPQLPTALLVQRHLYT